MNGSIGESGRTAPLSAGLSQPYRLRIKPDLQRTALLQGGIVGAPVRRAVGRGCGLAHASRLTPGSHVGNPSRFVQQSPIFAKREIPVVLVATVEEIDLHSGDANIGAIL